MVKLKKIIDQEKEMAYGKTLKMLLDERDIRVTDFAKEIGYNPNTIYSIIRRDPEKINPKLQSIMQEYFKIPKNVLSCYDAVLDFDDNNDYQNEFYVREKWASESINLYLHNLNTQGMEEAVHRVKELTKVPDYQRRAKLQFETVDDALGDCSKTAKSIIEDAIKNKE